MTFKSPVPIDYTGLVLIDSLTAVAATDTFPPGDRTFYACHNASGGAINITITVPGTKYGQARADRVVSLADGATGWYGPLVEDLADPTTGRVTIGHSGTSSVAGRAFFVPAFGG